MQPLKSTVWRPNSLINDLTSGRCQYVQPDGHSIARLPPARRFARAVRTRLSHSETKSFRCAAENDQVRHKVTQQVEGWEIRHQQETQGLRCECHIMSGITPERYLHAQGDRNPDKQVRMSTRQSLHAGVRTEQRNTDGHGKSNDSRDHGD